MVDPPIFVDGACTFFGVAFMLAALFGFGGILNFIGGAVLFAAGEFRPEPESRVASVAVEVAFTAGWLLLSFILLANGI